MDLLNYIKQFYYKSEKPIRFIYEDSFKIRVKGNQVQVLNRPAAVSPQLWVVHSQMPLVMHDREGGQTGQVRRPARQNCNKTAGTQ